MGEGLLVIWYSLTGIIIFCMTIAFIAYRRRTRKAPHRFSSTASGDAGTYFFASARTRSTYRIGILSPLANSPADFLRQGLLNQLQSSPHANYHVTLFDGNNDRVALFNKAVEALESCDIVVPFGLSCTNIAYEAARHTGRTKPIVFAGIKSHHIPLLRRHNPERKLIGIISQRDYFTQINQLRAIKPGMKNVLILYRQQLEWLIKETNDICRYLDSVTITATAHLLPNSTHIDNQLGTVKEPFDTIVLMPHTLNAKGLQELITYCNIKGITLCATELDAVTLGAAVGFGGQEETIGTRVGRVIRDILEVRKEPQEDTIIEHVDDYQVHINFRTISQQDITLTPELLFLLNQGEVTHQTPVELTQAESPSTQSGPLASGSPAVEQPKSRLIKLNVAAPITWGRIL